MNRHRHMHDVLASHRRRLVSSAAAAVLLAGWVAPAYADATIDTALEGLAPMTPGDLSDERGGFSFGNMNISFGFSISTTVAGGTLGPGVTVTTNFTINTPGDLKNLGTTITNNVQSQLKEKGLIDDGNPATPTLKQTIEDSVAASVAHLKPDDTPSAPTSTVVASAPATLAESAANPAPPVVDTTPIVEVTMVSAPDIPPPPPPESIAEIAPPSLPPLPAPVADAAPPPDLPPPPATVGGVTPPPGLDPPPATKPETDPGPAANTHSGFTATVDPGTGKISLDLGSGGGVLLEYVQGQIAKVQNTANDVAITSEFKADYVIDGYNPVATASNLGAQVRSLTDQLLALGGH